jgi:ABC-type nitrate/sulfonate/bicarbonate transport system substrate-binding protein
MRGLVRLAAALLLACASVGAFAQGTPPKLVRVIVFDGAWNLPIWAAQRQGLFLANGLVVSLAYTPNSVFMMQGLMEGRFDVALAGIDNLVGYQEGQGEVKTAETPDLFAFMGGDNGFLRLVAAPAVKSAADLKGKTLSVDAMNTGFAFVLRELVGRSGVAEADVTYVRAGATGNRYRAMMEGKQDATLLRPPFDLFARARGYNVLATADALGPYQGTSGVARRAWARENEASLVAFIRVYRAALDWLYDPRNRDTVETMLIAYDRDMTGPLAKQAYDALIEPKGGLTRDAAIDVKGLETVLALRSKYGTPQKTLTDPMKYIDNSYFEKASQKQ